MIWFITLAFAEETIWIEGESASTNNFSDHTWFNNVNRDLLAPGTPGVENGDWLIHYNMSPDSAAAQAAYSFDVTDGGEYEVWLRVLTPGTEGWISVDSGNQIDLDIDSNLRESVNLIWPSPYDFASWCGVGDYCAIHHYIGWVKAGDFNLSPGSHSLTFGVDHHENWNGGIVGGVDSIVIFNHHWGPSGSGQPDATENSPDEWFAFHPTDTPEDWSESVTAIQLDTPAGLHGAAQQQGADVVFEDGTEVKFWGVNAFPPGNEDRMLQQASLFSAMGVNLVRIHPIQQQIGNPIEADKMEQYDLWFSILKEHGIYTQWSVFWPHVITEDDGYPLYSELDDGSTSGLVTVFPELQAFEWQYLEPLMAHVNPYTGMSYADDPALAIVEVRNEDSIFFHNPLSNLSNTYPEHTAILQRNWVEWLSEKYGSNDELLRAWGDGAYTSDGLDNAEMKIYHSWEMGGDGPINGADEVVLEQAPRMGDWIEFLANRQCDGYIQRKDNLRSSGYSGVVLSTGWKVGGMASSMANLWSDDCLEMIDRHTYQGGGDYLRGGILTTGEVSQESAHAEPGTGVMALNHMQVESKPMQHSEWIASVPSPWKADSVPTYGFYGMGLYGWDAGLNLGTYRGFSYDGGWPDLSMWEIMVPHHFGQYAAVARSIHERHLTEGTPAHAERFSEPEVFTGLDERAEYDAWLGAVGPIVKSFEGGTTETVDLEDYRDGDFINSNTGELAWHTDGWYKVTADNTQAIVGQAGPGSISLPDIEVELTNEFVSLIFTSLDGYNLATSSSILVTAMAKDKQTGTIYNSDMTELVALGGPPLLLEPVQATLTFGGEPIIAVNILDAHGVPTGVVEDVINNTVVIDGRWKTAWYQIQRESPEDVDLVAPKDGCGCSAPASPIDVGGWFVLIGLLVQRRRR